MFRIHYLGNFLALLQMTREESFLQEYLQNMLEVELAVFKLYLMPPQMKVFLLFLEHFMRMDDLCLLESDKSGIRVVQSRRKITSS